MTRLLAFLLGMVFLLLPSAIIAQTAPSLSSAAIRGVVSDPTAGPIAQARVAVSGANGTQTATTTSDGAFAFTGLAAGIYRITVNKGGYQPAILTDLALAAGIDQRADVSLQPVTLTSLKVIGSVATAARGSRSTFNTSAASVSSVTAETFREQAAPQVMQILDQTPGIVAGQQGGAGNGAAAASITFANIRGGLSYETSTLLDGHPLANVSGFYNLQYLNPAVFGNVDVIKGPGAASPQINYAIGGSVNFRTLDPTSSPRGDLIAGIDSYGGSFSSLAFTGSALHGRLGYAVVNAYNGTPGPNNGVATNFALTNSVNSLNASAPNPSGGAAVNFGGTSKIVPIPNVQNPQNLGSVSAFACCFPVSDQYFNKSQLLKLRYALSSATSVTASYLGSQTMADVEGYHASLFPSTFAPAKDGSYGPYNSGDTVPLETNLILPGERQTDNEPIFQAELRTSIAVLARYYSASIGRFTCGAICGGSSTATFAIPLQVYGTAGSATYSGQTVPVTFQPTGCVGANGKAAPTFATAAYCTNPVFFASGELDRLDGGSFEYDHFAGPNVYTVSVDQSRLNGYSFKPGSAVSVPSIPRGTSLANSAVLLRGQLQLAPAWNATLSNYFNTYVYHASTNGGLTFEDTHKHHYDARLGLEWRPSQGAAFRLAYGSAIAPPPLSLFDITASPISAPSTGATSVGQRLPNPALLPETAVGFNLGASLRGHDPYTIVNVDLYRTNLFNQIINTYTTTCCYAVPGGSPLPIITQQENNLSNARYEGIEAEITRQPPLGWGFVTALSLIRAYPYSVPAGFYGLNYNQNLAILAGANFLSAGAGISSTGTNGVNSVGNSAIPYAQGYGEISYREPSGTLLSLGATYYGNNNSYNRPAFFVWNSTLRVPILGVNSRTTLQVSGYNLSGAYPASFIDQGGGVPIPLVNGKTALTNGNDVGPRRFRFLIEKRFGR